MPLEPRRLAKQVPNQDVPMGHLERCLSFEELAVPIIIEHVVGAVDGLFIERGHHVKMLGLRRPTRTHGLDQARDLADVRLAREGRVTPSSKLRRHHQHLGRQHQTRRRRARLFEAPLERPCLVDEQVRPPLRRHPRERDEPIIMRDDPHPDRLVRRPSPLFFIDVVERPPERVLIRAKEHLEQQVPQRVEALPRKLLVQIGEVALFEQREEIQNLQLCFTSAPFDRRQGLRLARPRGAV